MVRPAVTAWEKCCRDVIKLCTYTDGGRVRAGFGKAVDATDNAPATLCTATAQQLVDMQVPGQLSVALAAAASLDPRSPATTAATAALKRFLLAACVDGRIQGSNAICEQIKRADLLLLLPAVMAAAAEDLDAHASSSSSIVDRDLLWRAPRSTDVLHTHVNDLLMLLVGLQELRPTRMATRDNIVLTLAPGMLQLVMAVMRWLHTRCQRHQQQQQQQRHEQQQQQQRGRGRRGRQPQQQQVDRDIVESGDVAYSCCLAMIKFSRLVDHQQWWEKPAAAPLLQCRCMLPALSLMAAIAVFAAASDDASEQDGGGRSSSSSSSSRSGGPEAAAWRDVDSSLDCVTACHEQLLSLLGVDGRTVLFCAHLVRRNNIPFLVVRPFLSSIIMLISQCQDELQPADAEEEERNHQLYMLGSSLWTFWARSREQQADPDREAVLQDVADAATVTMVGLQQWAGEEEEEEEEEDTDSTAGSDGWRSYLEAALTKQLPPELVAELLPQVLQLLGVFLEGYDRTMPNTLAVVMYLCVLCKLLKHSPQQHSAATAAASGAGAPNVLDTLPVLDACVRYLAPVVPDPPELSAFKLERALIDIDLNTLARLVCSSSREHTGSSGRSSSGSNQLQQLYSVINSMLKMSSVYVGLPEVTGMFHCAASCLIFTGIAAVSVLGRLTRAARTGADFSSLQASELHEIGSGGSSSTTITPTQQPPAAAADWEASVVADVLPALKLFGHYCLHLLHALKTELPPITQASVVFRNDMLSNSTEVCIEWLEVPSVAAQLSAAGYEVQEVLQALQQLQAVVEQLEDEDDEQAAAAHTQPAFQQQLAAAGRACSSFAVRGLCNNPGCVNTRGKSESKIVSGSGCICGGCRTARYCCKACQREHWKAGHKPVCKALAEAAAGKAAVVES